MKIINEKYLELFKKYNKDGFAIKGSWVIKMMSDDFKRTPNDIDLIVLDKNEDFDHRFNWFKDMGYIKDIKEKYDLFDWQDDGEKIEVALTVSAFSTLVHNFHGEDIIVENPLSILGQKTLSSIAFLFSGTHEKTKQNDEDILFLLNKYSLKDVTDEMIKHFIEDHYKLEQEKVIMYFVDGWEKQYDELFNQQAMEEILPFLERVKNIASNDQLYLNIKETDYFNYKEWKLKNES